MPYSRFQQFLSYLLIVSILLLQTFEIPFMQSASAADASNARIVSFIVDEETYDDFSSEISTYAKDIEAYMDNVRVAVFPVPRTVNPYEIASVNEKLYFEGDGRGLSQLIGTILIGPVPLPVVHKENKTFLSLYPYTDFEEKAFVYDQEKNYYDHTDKGVTERPEIWHSVISPNTGDASQDAAQMEAFFAKTHAFYQSKGVFSESLSDPYVFYYDGYREQQAARYVPYKMYQEWIRNVEDLTYKRTNKHLLKAVSDAFHGLTESEAKSDIDTSKLDPKLQALVDQATQANDEFATMPDGMARPVIDKILKIFHESINEVYFGDLMKFVFNTGRYGNGQNVRVDTIPVLIDKKDREMQKTLLTGNNLMEQTIDAVVKKSLAKPIKIKTVKYTCRNLGLGALYEKTRYYNYLEGNRADAITSPAQCSVFRWGTSSGSVLTESDRAFNLDNLQKDTGTNAAGKLMEAFGNHSPFNVDFSAPELPFRGPVNRMQARAPLQDIAGSVERQPGSITADRGAAHAASYRDCDLENYAKESDWKVGSCSESVEDKEIPSWMEHKSPTNDEYKAILAAKATRSVPADRDRYIDFQTQAGAYKKIVYPNFFRYSFNTLSGSITYATVQARVKQDLDAKSAEVGGGIDLYATLSADAKLLDSVIRHIIWQNLSSPTAKYKYVLEHYLDTDSQNALKDVAHKSDYEMAYIGAPGTARNMYVRFDPEEKGAASGKIKKILDRVNATKQALDAASIARGGSGQPAVFKCGWPEGVELPKWPGAIQCWLKGLMPVGISAGGCTAGTLGMPADATSSDEAITTDDTDKNGVPDAAEALAQGKITLTPSHRTASYGESVGLEASLLGSDDKILQEDSFSQVSFELSRVVSVEGAKRTTVFDAPTSASATGALSDYVTFTPQKVRARAGRASYVLSTKYRDADVTLMATVQTKDRTGRVVVDAASAPVTLRVRGDRLSVIAQVKESTTYETSSAIEAGNPFGVTFAFDKQDKNGKKLDLDAPYELRIFDDVTGAEIFDKPIVVSAAEKQSFIFKNPNILNKAGVYRFEFTDSEDLMASQTITVLPAKVASIRLSPASSKFVRGQKVAVLVELFDRFNNIVKGDVYDIKAKLTGVGTFESGLAEYSESITEGFLMLPVTASERGAMSLKVTVSGVESPIATLEAVDFARVEATIADKDAIIVGGKPHAISFRVVDAAGKVISGFHTTAAVSVPEFAGSLSTNRIDIRDGVSTTPLQFTPYTVAQDAVRLSVEVLGVQNADSNVFSIHSERPIRIGFHDVSQKIEAKAGNLLQVKTSIYDQYGNIASYKTEGYAVTLTIPEEYASLISLTGGAQTRKYVFSRGTAISNIYATDIPGGAWVLAKLEGDIKDGSIEAKWSDGKVVTIPVPAVTEDAAKIDTYYFWNSEKLAKTKYNTLFTTLFGADYGDVTQAGYLGGSVVFNEEGRSLAVTSLLNNPYQKNLAFGFTPAGKYIAPASDGTAFQMRASVESVADRLVIDFHDGLRKESVARAWIRPDAESVLTACDGGAGKTIAQCAVVPNRPYLLLQGTASAQVQKTSDSLSLMLAGIKIFEISKNGIQSRYPGLALELNPEATGNYLGMKITLNKEPVGYLAMRLSSEVIRAYPSSAFPGALASDGGAIILETISNRYSAVSQYLGNSSAGARGIALYAWSEDQADYEPDPVLLGGGELLGLESALKENGIGWQTSNKMMLLFAAGNGMGDATRFYQTYSTVNLGDPIAHLPPKKHPLTKQDRTIGAQIAEGRGEPIESYEKLDFNGDNQEDIVIFYESGKVELLANYGGHYKNLGYWAFAPDALKKMKKTGVFAGPDAEKKRFSSLVMVAEKTGGLILLENRQGKLIRRDMSAEVKPTTGTSRIRQLEVFDMDRDGADDLVIVFESGELDIFYGGTRLDGAGKRVVAFTRKLIDESLKIKLSSESRDDGGALYFPGLPQLPDAAGQSRTQADFLRESEVAGSAGVPQGVDDAIFGRYVYYQYAYDTQSAKISGSRDVAGIAQAGGTDPVTGQPDVGAARSIASGFQEIEDFQAQDATFTPPTDEQITARNPKPLTFIRSEYAPAKGVSIEKTYATGSGNVVTTGSPLSVTVRITNNTGKSLTDAIYLEEPDPLLHLESGLTYSLEIAGKKQEGTARQLADGEYTYAIDGLDIPSGMTAILRYTGIANPVDIGRINVGILENDDAYGDIALNPSKTCGATYLLWKSTAVRTYVKTNKTFASTATAPVDTSLTDQIKQLTDKLASASGIDRDAIIAQIQALSKQMQGSMGSMFPDNDGNGIPDAEEIPGSDLSLLTEEGVNALSNTIDDVVKGLGCGFGWGSCWAAPMNYAPLAPGSSPVMMGYPLMPLTPHSIATQRGLPTFAFPTTCGPVVVWPPCPTGAGGWFGGNSSMFRLFWTPTLTWGQGIAMCFGPRLATGGLPPAGVSPVVPGGNCIVAAAPLNTCKADGSDGDVSGNGYGSQSDDGSGKGWKSYLNANECKKGKESLTKEDKAQLIEFARGGSFDRDQLRRRLSALAGNMRSRSLISLWGDEAGGLAGGDISIDVDAIMRGDLGGIVKVNLKRIFPFPDFIMQWVTRQTEEFVNKLTDLPTLYIYLPDFTPLTGSIANVSKTYSGAIQKAKEENAQAQADAQNIAKNESVRSKLNKNAKAAFAKNLGSMNEAFTVMSSLPLIEMSNEEITVDVPMITKEEIAKMQKEYETTKKQWEKELSRAKTEWAKLGTASGASSSVAVDAENSIRSIDKNIKVLDSYAKFPEKLYKLLTWKEMYIGQILCNITSIQEVTTGWMSRNGKRFKSWVELYVLIKAILKSWQLVIDVFTGYEAECSACKNERWNLWHFIFKLISAILPQVPVIQFPKWPDIILDLTHVRWALRIKIPTFDLNPKPMNLPYLPKLVLPDTPNASLGLPQIPVLPKLPDLPALPELPSLPRVSLPDLPPPPTIPKLFGYIEVFLNVLKLIKKVLCIMRINPFVPEWYAGTQIAILTERQGKLPIDFIDVSMPQFSYPWVDAIRVTSYVNLEFDADFIVEFARSILQPVNQFSTDFSHLGNIVKPPKNIAVPGVDNVDVKVTPQGVQGYQSQDALKRAATAFAFGVAREITRFTAYLETAKDDTIDTKAMKALFAENIASLEKHGGTDGKRIASVLRDAVNYDGSAEDAIIARATDEQTKKWKDIRSLVDEHSRSNTETKAVLGRVLQGKASIFELPELRAYTVGNIRATSQADGKKEALAERISERNTRALQAFATIGTGDPRVKDIQATGQQIKTTVRTGMEDFTRLMTYNAALPSSTENPLETASESLSGSVATVSREVASDSASSQTDQYEYNGLYLLYTDGSGKQRQTHLFDYVDETEGTEAVIPLDVHRDGDEDVLFRIGNGLFIKYAGPNLPKNTSGDTKKYDYVDFLEKSSAPIQSAVNYFQEAFDAPDEINFSFRAANKKRDTKFRFEMFDYIDRFDRRDSGEDEKDIRPLAKKDITDLVTDEQKGTEVTDTLSGVVLQSTLATFAGGSGEGNFTAPIADRWTTASGAIDITEGKTIYTADQGATVQYRVGESADWRTLVIRPGQNMRWDVSGTLRVISGEILLFREATETRTVDLAELKLFPLVDGMRIVPVSPRATLRVKYFDGDNLLLDGGASYEYRSLGEISDDYQISLSRENDFYYAKMYPFSAGIRGTVSNLALQAPQIHGDKEPPVVTLGRSFRIPVYQAKNINLLKYITDISGIDRVWVEGDDFIKMGNTTFDLVFGRYTSLFTKAVRFFVQDIPGNVTSQDMTLEVYAPIPQITGVVSRVVHGILNESLKDEPVDLYRHRNGRIDRISTRDILTDENGRFSYPLGQTASGVVLKNSSGSTLLTIDESTGKIKLQDSTLSISVTSATETARTRVQAKDAKGVVLFTQELSFPANLSIERADDLDAVRSDGIYVKIDTDGYGTAKNGSQVPWLPYGAYIVDTQKKPIAGLSKDGNVYLMASGYSLKYRETGAYPSYLLVDSANTIIAEILFRMKAEYVIQ